MPLRFTQQQLFQARERITSTGQSIADWARARDLDLQLTGHVLRGALKAQRGESYRIAVALGLRKPPAKKRSPAKSTLSSSPTA